MKTEFKDVAHLYMGCYVKWASRKGNIKKDAVLTGADFHWLIKKEYLKPFLRSLSDMTQEEFQAGGFFDEALDDLGCASFSDQYALFIREARAKEDRCWYVEQITFFLSKGFDLFGLIESGQAIDKTKL